MKRRGHGAHFLGVFPLNRLPKLTERNKFCCLIVNTDTSNLPGKHWLAVFLTFNRYRRRGEVFDSYGRPPPFLLQKWLNKTVRIPWTFNKRLVQGPLTTLCGAFCVYFLDKRCATPTYIPMRVIVNELFSKKYHVNDCRMNRFMLRAF